MRPTGFRFWSMVLVFTGPIVLCVGQGGRAVAGTSGCEEVGSTCRPNPADGDKHRFWRLKIVGFPIADDPLGLRE